MSTNFCKKKLIKGLAHQPINQTGKNRQNFNIIFCNNNKERERERERASEKMDLLTLLLTQLLLVIALTWLWLHRRYSYWSSRGIDGPRPVPFLGNFWQQMREGQLRCELEWRRRYGKLYGSYQFFDPTLTIGDHELIRQVMVKDFNQFVNRRKNRSDHEIWSRNLFGAEGADWKRIRMITSPTFTSGKLRTMTRSMNRCVDKLLQFLHRRCDAESVIDTKAVISGFTIDVIASTSFATETDANADRDQRRDSPFLRHGMRLFLALPLRIAAVRLIPGPIRRFFGLTLTLDPTHFDFFVALSREVIRARRGEKSASNNRRQDFVQLLMDARADEQQTANNVSYASLEATADAEPEEVEAKPKTETMTPDESSYEKTEKEAKNEKSLTENEIIAQCILFFAAGFETTASTLAHCLWELARNRAVQDKLFEHLRPIANADPNEESYYDELMLRKPYLDAVIKETLRKYPPVPRLTRRVMIDGYQLGGVTLRKNQDIEISAYGVHYDPEYYPDPKQFDPERFMPENKHLLTPYTYLPFGIGPRNCVGMRFAYQEIKFLLAKLITQFRFLPTETTPDELRFSKLGLMSVDEFQLKIEKRQSI